MDALVIKQVGDEPWVPATEFGLPEGCEYRIYKGQDEDELTVVMARFPPGYLEPRHEHDSDHWGVVVEGEMHVDGKILRTGDFHHAPRNAPHGPFYYPKGCIVFGTLRGGSILHEWTPEAADVDPATVEVRE